MLLEASGITKTFPGVVALDGCDFALRSGEVHVLFGENGAGKSTLIGILAGLRRPDSGTIAIDGRIVGPLDPRGARVHGIAAVFQEFSLVPSLSVLDNLVLGRETSRLGRLNRRTMRREAQAAMDELGFAVSLDERVGSLSRARKQMVEIVKALLLEARVLILDEPTASLTDSEADQLLDFVRQLRAKGVGIIYVSHRLREIRAVADRITVLRSGRRIGTIDRAQASEERLVEMMTGRRIDALFPPVPHRPKAVRLRLEGLATRDGRIRDITLDVQAGEAIGIAGLVGCGKSEVGRAAFGLEPLSAGTVTIDGRAVAPRSPRQMMREGLCYFPSDRNGEGLALGRSVRENGSMASLSALSRFGWLERAREVAEVERATARLALRPADIDVPVTSLSGGNRQKVMLTRGLMRDLSVYVFDEPTVGIDVGAKVEVYQFIADLVAQGAAVIVISSELSEVLALGNRVYIMRDGRIVRELAGAERSEENVLTAFFGSEANAAREQRA